MNPLPQDPTEQEARIHGYECGRRGLARALNTLPEGSPQHAAWNEGWDKAQTEAANYANAMIRRDKERPQWERENAQGARDPAIDYSRESNR